MSELLETLATLEKPVETEAEIPDSSQIYLPFEPVELGEMEAADALKVQLRLFEINRALPCYYQGMLTDYLSLVENQNRCVVQIVRLLLTASSLGKNIGTGEERGKLVDTLISEMSYHLRRLGGQVLDLKLDTKTYFRVGRLINEVITTIFRLQKTRTPLWLFRAKTLPKEKSQTAAAAGIDTDITPLPGSYRAQTPYQPLPQSQPVADTAAKTPSAANNPEQTAASSAAKKSGKPAGLTPELQAAIMNPQSLLTGNPFAHSSALKDGFARQPRAPDNS